MPSANAVQEIKHANDADRLRGQVGLSRAASDSPGPSRNAMLFQSPDLLNRVTPTAVLLSDRDQLTTTHNLRRDSMPWLQLSFDVPREQTERIRFIWRSPGALSVTLGMRATSPSSNPARARRRSGRRSRSRRCSSATPRARRWSSGWPQHLTAPLLGTRAASVERIEDQVWERVWLDTFKPTRFGQRLWVCPHGQDAG